MSVSAEEAVLQASAKAKNGAAYTVLRLVDDGELPADRWQAVGEFAAANGQLAIRKAVGARFEADEAAAGMYVAVPVRSFKPVAVKVKEYSSLRIDGV